MPTTPTDKQEPSRIFLEPSCVIEHGGSDRLWCEDDWGECEECGTSSVEYVRADLVATREELFREALRPFACEADDWPTGDDDERLYFSIEDSDGYDRREMAYFRLGDLRRARNLLKEKTMGDMPHTTPTDLNADARYLRMLADDITHGFRPVLKSSELNQNALRLREIAERLERTGEEN